MPKGKKTKKAPVRALSSTSLYYNSILDTFNGAKQIFNANAILDHYIGMSVDTINNLHLSHPNSNKLPALFVYLSTQKLQERDYNFLNTLKSNGLQVEFGRHANIFIISYALEKRNKRLLEWLIQECGLKIPTSGLNAEGVHFDFDLDKTAILDFIEGNYTSSEAQFYIDLIANNHEDGNSILHLAAIHNKPNLFHLLMINGADLNQQNHSGVTPAMYAVEYEDSRLFPLLVNEEYGKTIDVSLKTTDETSIFHKIVLGKNTKILEFAIAKLRQQDLNFSDLTIIDGYNIVHWAIDNQQCALIYNLLPLVDTSVLCPDGNHLVVYAFINDEPEIGMHIATHCKIDLSTATFNDGKTILEIIIEEDALTSFICLTEEMDYEFELDKPDINGVPPILLAAQHDSQAILNTLLEEYEIPASNFTAQATNGKKIGHFLAEQNYTENLEFLLNENLLDLKHADADGNTILDILLLHKDSHTASLDLILDYLEKNQKSKRSSINFQLAKIKQLNLLIEVYCADELGKRNKTIDGHYPIFLACEQGDLDFVEYLVHKYAIDINAKLANDEKLLYTIIKKLPNTFVVNFINKFQPKLTNLDKHNSNILHLACEHNIVELIDFSLKKHHFNITKRRNDNFSALDLTLIRRNSKILHLLWVKLSIAEQEDYLNNLHLKQEWTLLDYLEKEALYTKPEPPPEISPSPIIDTHPSMDEIPQNSADIDEHISLITSPCETDITDTEILSPIEEQTKLKEEDIELTQFTEILQTQENTTKPKVINREFDILNMAVSELNIHAEEFESPPQCFLHDKLLRNTLTFLTNIFTLADLYGLIYGSAHNKLRPGDIDILIPEYEEAKDSIKLKKLINLFTTFGGTVTSIDKRTGGYGFIHEGRYLIPIDWYGVKIELVASPKTVIEHAIEMDVTANARYFCVRTLRYVDTPGINAKEDIQDRILRTIIDPETSFLKDPRRIFRGIKQATDTGFTFAPDYYQAIQNIFADRLNPFLNNISRKKVFYRMQVMLETGREGLYFNLFNELGIFEKLYECISAGNDYTSQYYTAILDPYLMLFSVQKQQEIMQRTSQCMYTMFPIPIAPGLSQNTHFAEGYRRAENTGPN